jgi:hypothetical protein
MQTGPTDCPETHVRTDHYTLRNVADERGSHLYRSGSLKSISELFTKLKAKLIIHSLPSKSSSSQRPSAIFHPHAKCLYLISFGLFWPDLSLWQFPFKFTWASCNTGQGILLRWRFPASLVGGPPFVNYMLLHVEYTRSYLPYVEAVFFTSILWHNHATVTTDPLTRCHFLTDRILFVYVISPNNRALKVSIPLLGRYVCFCLPERRL